MKKTVSLILSVILLAAACVLPVCAEDAETLCSTAADVIGFVIVTRENTVPMRIVPAEIAKNGETKPVYLIGLLGVKSNAKQVNSGKNLVPAAFNRANSYYDLVKQTIRENIPAGSALMFACHSLGGMVAQAIRTDKELKEEYEILNVLTAGSPLILVTEEGEGSLHRLADKYDLIPFMSPATVRCLAKQIKTAHREDGGYFFNPDGAHNLSYLRNDVWGDYDVFGEKGGDGTLRYNAAETQLFGVAE